MSRNADQAPPDEGGRRSGDLDYTELRVSELEARAGGVLGADTLATAQACVSWWERSCAALQVEPGDTYTEALTPNLLGIAGRALAVYGNAVYAIRVERGRVLLIPASSYDVEGGPDPATWRYRLDLVGSTRTETVRTTGAGVLHFRLGVDRAQAWHGVAPLRRSSATSILARRLELSLADEARFPLSRTVSIDGVPAQANQYANDLRGGGIVVRAEKTPSTAERRPLRVGPEPPGPLVELRRDVADDIAPLFGLHPLLFSPRADGQSTREARRLFLTTTLKAMTAVMQAEIRAKLDAPGAVVSTAALMVNDEETAALSVSRRAAAVAKLQAAGVSVERALRLAGLEG